jgi:hypothetical protein
MIRWIVVAEAMTLIGNGGSSRHAMIRVVSAVLFLTLVLPAARVQAQASDRADDRAGAEALFLAGRAALRRGDYRSALAKFNESNRLDPAVGTILNLAICEEHLGQLASAWQRYREVLHALPPGDDRLPVARARAAAIEARVPRLKIRVAPSAPKDTQISRNGVVLTSASFGVELPLDPGTHEFIVVSPGRSQRRYSARLAEGARQELTVEPGPPLRKQPVAKPASTKIDRRNERNASFQRTAGFITAGGGVASLIFSAVAGVLVLDRKQTVDRECDGASCNDAGLEAADSGRTLSSLSTIAFSVGLLAVGSGTYLILSSRPSGNTGMPPVGSRFMGVGHAF